MKLRKSMLLGSVSAAVMMASPSVAQDADTAAADEFDEIVVTGIRGSLRQSLDVKRNRDAIVDAVSAEDIGAFPDRNIAESMQRIPGITIARSFGEGESVAIRGASSNMTMTTLNGQNVASTGWFVFQPPRRSFNYALLPSELVGQIEIYKSSQADLPEGGVGGTVIIHTRKPLDLDPLTIQGSVEGMHQNDSDKIDPQFSGLFSWKNEAENFGVLVSGVYQRRHLQRQGNEAFWEWGAGMVGFEQDRKRRGVTATVQWQPTENLDITANYIDLQMRADNTNFALWLTQGNCSWCETPSTEADMINETTVRGPIGAGFYQIRPREATMNSDSFDVKMTYSGEGYEFKLHGGRTKSTGGTDFEMVVDPFDFGNSPINIPGGTFDFSGDYLTWDLAGFDLSTAVPENLTMGTGPNFNRTPKRDEETYLQADLEFDVDWGMVHSVKTGAKYVYHETDSRRFEYVQRDDFVNEIPVASLSSGTFDVGVGDFQMVRLDPDALKDWAKATIVGENEDLGAFNEIQEKNFSAYAMASFEGDGFRGNFGLRAVHTDAKALYYVEGSQTSADASYWEWLPSFNVVVDLAEDVLLRGSAARVLTRPQYVDMFTSPDVTGADNESPDDQFWIIGNVGLKPFVSNQFDLGVEWYFAESSLLSVGFFLKDVKNFVTRTDRRATAAEVPFTGINETEAGFGWTIQQLENAHSASLKGFEFQYQQDFANGFGAIFNYTYTDSNADDEDTFPDGRTMLSDASKHSFNASAYYEGETFNARLSYNYRSKYMLREVGAYGNRLHKGFGTMDFTASYFVNDNITLNLDVTNILQNDDLQTGYNRENTPRSGFTPGFPLYQYETARSIVLGASFKY